MTLGTNINNIFSFFFFLLLFLIFCAKYYSIQFLQQQNPIPTQKKKMKKYFKYFYIYKNETDFSRYENGISLIFYKLQENLNHILEISFYVYRYYSMQKKKEKNRRTTKNLNEYVSKIFSFLLK